jgi:ferredoxin-NADP reductase
MSRIYHATIIDRKVVAEDTLEVSFKRPEDFSFLAGQYIQLGVSQLLYPDIKGVSRTFSIASSPYDQERISVAFRDTGSGFKRTLKELPFGAPVNIEGAHGFFTLPQELASPVVFIAGGIGITPFLSMIRFADEKELASPMTLLYANRSKESAAYLDELQTIANRNKDFILKNRFGKIDEEFMRQDVKNMEQSVWYIAGPPAMVTYARNALFLLGIEDSRVHCEEFAGYE